MTQTKVEVNENEEAGKIFVGGLSWETTQEKLQEYFSRFGEVVDCVVMKNNETGKSRGFGFVTFKDVSCVAKVLSNGPHEVDGRTIDPKVCSSRDTQQNKKAGQFPKVFLGGLPPNCTETDLRSFFSRYGTVIEVVLMYDQEKKKSRGFGFLSFETEDSVKQVCAEHFVKINGKKIECKHAEPRDKKRPQQQTTQANQWGGPPMGPPGWGPGAPAPGAPGPCGPTMGPGGPMPGPMPGPMGPPMNNGMMGPPASGYQGGWGGPPPYGPQGGWGPHPGGYGPGYNSWGCGPGYGGPYNGPPGPQYGQAGYGYGYNYGGYGGPMGGPPPPNPPAPGTENFSGTGGMTGPAAPELPVQQMPTHQHKLDLHHLVWEIIPRSPLVLALLGQDLDKGMEQGQTITMQLEITLPLVITVRHKVMPKETEQLVLVTTHIDANVDGSFHSHFHNLYIQDLTLQEESHYFFFHHLQFLRFFLSYHLQ